MITRKVEGVLSVMNTHGRMGLILALILVAFGSAAVAQGGGADRPGRGGRAPGGPAPAAGETPAPAAADAARIEVSVGDGTVSVFAVNADAHDVFSRIATATGLPLIVDDAAQGRVTINIVNKPPLDVLALLVDAYGFSFSEVGEVYVISEGVPKKPSSYLLGDIATVTTNYVQPARARSLLPLFLQGDVKMNTDQNAVVLSGPRAVLDKFRQDVEQFDVPAAQIMLDVLVVEYTDVTTDSFAAGLGRRTADVGLTTDSLTGQVVLTTVTTLPREFFANLRALVATHKARVRANPRVATVSGLHASVFIGQERYLRQPVRLPGVSGQSNSIDAGVRLRMRPLTGGQGEIILWIDQEISTLSAPDPSTGLPDKTKRTATTTVRVRDGQTVVIGGLRQDESRERRRRIPVVSEIPLIGGLFRSKRVEHTSVELAVFITARILDDAGRLPEEEERRIRERFLPAEESAAQVSP